MIQPRDQMVTLIFKNIIKKNTITSILFLLLIVPHPTYAWHEILGPGDKIILKKDYRLAPGRTLTIWSGETKHARRKCDLFASGNNKRTIIIKSGKQYEIKSAKEYGVGREFLQVSVEKGEFGFSLTYDCKQCYLHTVPKDCGGLVTIIHQKAVEF